MRRAGLKIGWTKNPLKSICLFKLGKRFRFPPAIAQSRIPLPVPRWPRRGIASLFFAMLMTVLALGPICLLLIGAWSFFWPSPLKLILLVAFLLGAMLIVAGDSER
jgi:hypothetical protein